MHRRKDEIHNCQPRHGGKINLFRVTTFVVNYIDIMYTGDWQGVNEMISQMNLQQQQQFIQSSLMIMMIVIITMMLINRYSEENEFIIWNV